MKLLIIATCLALMVSVQALTEEQLQNALTWSGDCKKSSGATTEMVSKTLVGEWTEDDKLKAYIDCFGKKAGVIKDDGSIDLEAIKKKHSRWNTDKDAVTKSVEDCEKDNKKGSTEETLVALVQCLTSKRNDYSNAH